VLAQDNNPSAAVYFDAAATLQVFVLIFAQNWPSDTPEAGIYLTGSPSATRFQSTIRNQQSEIELFSSRSGSPAHRLNRVSNVLFSGILQFRSDGPFKLK
jgi:hypothetical protein